MVVNKAGNYTKPTMRKNLFNNVKQPIKDKIVTIIGVEIKIHNGK